MEVDSMCVCMLCVYACIFIYTHQCMLFFFIHIHTYIHTYIHRPEHKLKHMQITFTQRGASNLAWGTTRFSALQHTYTYTHVRTKACTQTHTHVHIYIQVTVTPRGASKLAWGRRKCPHNPASCMLVTCTYVCMHVVG